MNSQESAFREFAEFAARFRGDEKSEAQTFLFHLREAFSLSASKGERAGVRFRLSGVAALNADGVHGWDYFPLCLAAAMQFTSSFFSSRCRPQLGPLRELGLGLRSMDERKYLLGRTAFTLWANLLPDKAFVCLPGAGPALDAHELDEVQFQFIRTQAIRGVDRSLLLPKVAKTRNRHVFRLYEPTRSRKW